VGLLDSLYQELVLEHYRKPRNHGALQPFDVREEGINPSCGDEVTLYLRFDGETIQDVSFEGEGCAISQASASMLTEAVKGLSSEAALALSQRFREMLHGAEPDRALGDLSLLRGVAKLPARTKCAALPFSTLEVALGRGGPQG